ncbi:sodium channel protein Nach-like [Schistocerca cancellata]|uniref:sodium channel protein Nach-like n=1 Tax=Schistocerca cancellata TaxID=274614 RepID=UPI0021190983|nr:sodium channel protein Nach-like [Schistocerca cancellata]
MLLWEAVKEYLSTSSIHGLRFIVQSGRHWTERLFWLICCVLSWYASALLIKSSWNAFQNNAVSFAMETLYLNFSTDFPAVIVCEKNNDDRIKTVMNRNMGIHDFDLEEIYAEITFFHGEAHFTKDACYNTKVKRLVAEQCPQEGLKQISQEFHTPCNGLIFNCTWNGITFHCCEQFLPLDTEIGLCFAINSWQTNHLRYNASPLNMVSDANTGPGRLYFEIGEPVMVYVLATQEVPTINTPEYRYFFMKPGRQVQHRYSVKEVENDQAVHELTIKQRHCRFHYENYDNGLYPYYAYSVCITECRKKAQLQLCNCASHQLPNNKRVCNLSGIVCISDHHAYLSVLRNKESSKNALLCTCEQSCEDQLITHTYGTIRMLKSQHGALEISLQSLPYERLKRTVVRSHLDMVVYTGAVAGLLVGASLLSFVEILYHITIRIYWTIYKRAQQK